MVSRDSMNVPQASDTTAENSSKVDLECEDNKNLNLSDIDSDMLGKFDFKHKNQLYCTMINRADYNLLNL